MEVQEITKIVIVLIVLALMLGVFFVLLKGGGGRMLDSIRNIFRFGG